MEVFFMLIRNNVVAQFIGRFDHNECAIVVPDKSGDYNFGGIFYVNRN